MKPKKVEPIYLFITGGGGARKSHLIKTIYHTVIKTFRYGGMNPENPTVLLSAPTGVAAININGTTINAALLEQSLRIQVIHCLPCQIKKEHK